MEYLDLAPIARVNGTVALPGSKSISNRTLLLAALAQGTTEVKGLLAADDIHYMLEALKALGIKWQQIGESRDFIVHGAAGAFPVKAAELFLGNAGTAFRPLTAALALSQGHYTLSGVARMHERPIGDLVNALREAGAEISCTGVEGYPPLSIKPAAFNGQVIKVKGNVSSQFLTALLMALPLTGQAVTIEVIGELISKPYIDITLKLMAKFGVQVKQNGWSSFSIAAGQTYQSPGMIEVEGDASSASYFLAAGAMGGGKVRVTGMGSDSIQGDKRFAEALALMGAEITWGSNFIEAAPPKSGQLTGIDADMNHIPDAAMTLAVAALFAKGPTTLRNIASWRVKETDRLSAMATELRKIGASVIEGEDFITVTPPESLIANAAIDTYDDHRMAMCFSLVAVKGVAVQINDPQCTAKTFPTYFEELAKISS